MSEAIFNLSLMYIWNSHTDFSGFASNSYLRFAMSRCKFFWGGQLWSPVLGYTSCKAALMSSTLMKMLSVCCPAWCVQKLPALRITGCHSLIKWPPVPRIVTGLWRANLLSPTIVSAYFPHEWITSSAELATYHCSGLSAVDWTEDGLWLFIKRKSENMASFTFYNCICCSRVITY